ncbi:hypothetical protein NM688_g3917 [Phlebia brevispora]|uniref:Uncharacterized protein n=1 Tax=Phlebia brevispora TaxID=194682 RepID=A0ACC1T442_9APHY|nr:hypothetical protein NM688_g3917 [Phlebia brevispora]
MKEAIRECAVQAEIYKTFTEQLLTENVQNWLRKVVAYEADLSLLDPYYRKPDGLTEADVRLQLAEKDDRAVVNGRLRLYDVTPATMLLKLLEIEEL